MIISKTPYRISLFGGGTDYPDWFRQHGGAVVGTTIDKYCYVSVNYLAPFHSHKFMIIWSKVEKVDQIGDIVNPVVRATLDLLNFHEEGVEVSHRGDLPARSGLGTSSSFAVGLLNALHTLRGFRMSRGYLANTAIEVEQKILKEAVGNQDQIWAAHGDFNRIEFNMDGTYQVKPLALASPADLQHSLMLFFTGFTRFASEIAQKQIDNFPKKESVLFEMSRLCDEACVVLQNSVGDLLVNEIGNMLHQSWLLKKSLADEVSTDAVDEIYEQARAAGAYGGKLLGAGGGGFVLFVVPPKNKAAVRARLHRLIEVPIGFDAIGSQIIVGN